MVLGTTMAIWQIMAALAAPAVAEDSEAVLEHIQAIKHPRRNHQHIAVTCRGLHPLRWHMSTRLRQLHGPAHMQHLPFVVRISGAQGGCLAD